MKYVLHECAGCCRQNSSSSWKNPAACSRRVRCRRYCRWEFGCCVSKSQSASGLYNRCTDYSHRPIRWPGPLWSLSYKSRRNYARRLVVLFCPRNSPIWKWIPRILQFCPPSRVADLTRTFNFQPLSEQEFTISILPFSLLFSCVFLFSVLFFAKFLCTMIEFKSIPIICMCASGENIILISIWFLNLVCLWKKTFVEGNEIQESRGNDM